MFLKMSFRHGQVTFNAILNIKLNLYLFNKHRGELFMIDFDSWWAENGCDGSEAKKAAGSLYDLLNEEFDRCYFEMEKDRLNLKGRVTRLEEKYRHHFSPESTDLGATDSRFCRECGEYITSELHHR